LLVIRSFHAWISRVPPVARVRSGTGTSTSTPRAIRALIASWLAWFAPASTRSGSAPVRRSICSSIGASVQLRRAVTSIALNLAEADGNRGGNRRMRLETAHGSANEAKVALRVAVAWRYVAQQDIDDIFAIIDRAFAMTWSRLQTP
jgi:four helix bundle protein